MPHFIKTGYWDCLSTAPKGYLNLEQVIANAGGGGGGGLVTCGSALLSTKRDCAYNVAGCYETTTFGVSNLAYDGISSILSGRNNTISDYVLAPYYTSASNMYVCFDNSGQGCISGGDYTWYYTPGTTISGWYTWCAGGNGACHVPFYNVPITGSSYSSYSTYICVNPTSLPPDIINNGYGVSIQKTNNFTCSTYSSYLPHVIVGGAFNSISTYLNNGNGLIGVGYGNTVSGGYATILNGYFNYANYGSTISNGYNVYAVSSSVVGNGNNSCAEYYSFIGTSNYDARASFCSFIGTAQSSCAYNCSFIGAGIYHDALNVSFVGAGFFNKGCTNYSFIGNGNYNVINATYPSERNTILNGCYNCISGKVGQSTIINGSYNYMCSTSCNVNASTIAAGGSNCIFNTNNGFIGSGTSNKIVGVAGSIDSSAILTGSNNYISGGTCNVIVAGAGNYINQTYNFIGTGSYNQATNTGSIVVGGSSNSASGYGSIVTSGVSNAASGNYSFLGGGVNNVASGFVSVLIGGSTNTSSGYQTIVGGGGCNRAELYRSGVFVGYCNIACSYYDVILGGCGNCTTVYSFGSFIGSGGSNLSNSAWSGIFGGLCNTTNHEHAFIAGCGIASSMACAFHTNRLVLTTLPTSAAGLPSGAVWRDAGAGNVLKIVP